MALFDQSITISKFGIIKGRIGMPNICDEANDRLEDIVLNGFNELRAILKNDFFES